VKFSVTKAPGQQRSQQRFAKYLCDQFPLHGLGYFLFMLLLIMRAWPSVSWMSNVAQINSFNVAGNG
jgi:hypothetical protein